MKIHSNANVISNNNQIFTLLNLININVVEPSLIFKNLSNNINNMFQVKNNSNHSNLYAQLPKINYNNNSNLQFKIKKAHILNLQVYINNNRMKNLKA